VLVAAATAEDASIRRTALASLGWCDPINVAAVVRVAQFGRTDENATVRHAATGVLARFGDRAALKEFTDAMASDDASVRAKAARRAGAEGLTWLWPELDALADSSDPETVLAATESLEQLSEHIFGPLG
jgi:HEAT repeat protein